MLQKNDSHNKFCLSYFIWLGCNYVVSITFVGTFATLSNLDAPNAIVIYVLWIIVLEGLIVGVCAHICARFAWIHHSYNNGGIYIFVRTSFGRFWGIFVAFMQYITLPFLITF
ncbi:amino acid permease [Spiroplasma endosymbiont of Sarcophaga variegata]|uniref:amino acid permease n=1 Tax=Spiroplasma endosymbiont of Sarcophaga variegata TaxID=3066304 RepID=UPI003AF912DA